jgi:hypothetical protein
MVVWAALLDSSLVEDTVDTDMVATVATADMGLAGSVVWLAKYWAAVVTAAMATAVPAAWLARSSGAATVATVASAVWLAKSSAVATAACTAAWAVTGVWVATEVVTAGPIKDTWWTDGPSWGRLSAISQGLSGDGVPAMQPLAAFGRLRAKAHFNPTFVSPTFALNMPIGRQGFVESMCLPIVWQCNAGFSNCLLITWFDNLILKLVVALNSLDSYKQTPFSTFSHQCFSFW